MQVIIAGGTGLIGNALAINLSRDGHQVFILSRSPEKYVSQAQPKISLVKWDGSTPNGWGKLVEGCDAIVNLSGENLAKGRWTTARKQRILSSRIQPGHAIVQAIQEAKLKPRLLIQASAIGYYGPRQDEIITESAEPGTDFLSRVCVSWEASTLPVESEGVRRVVIRSAVVLSSQTGPLSRMLLPYRFFAGGPVGSGKQWLSWIHIEDEVAAIRFLIDHPSASGPYNLAAPGALQNAAFSKIIGRVMRRPSFFPVPALLMKLIFGEMATVLLDGQRVIPERLTSLGFTFRYPDAEIALRDLLR